MLILAVATAVLLPLSYAWRLWRLRAGPRAVASLALEAGAVFALLAVVMRWDVVGFGLQWGLAVLLVAGFVRALVRMDRTASDRWGWGGLTSAVAFGALLVWGALPRGDGVPVDLTFPLADGTYVVVHGGPTPLLNHHSGHSAQDHALDIVALGQWGVRASGLLPRDLGAYAIFGAPVVSPCDGRVTEVVDGLPDLTPPIRDPSDPAGNSVVLDCSGLEVILAHLRRGSIQVVQDATVRAGDVLGEVGNSGNTTEPHLHIHAVDLATGLAHPVTFGGRRLTRNAVVSAGRVRAESVNSR